MERNTWGERDPTRRDEGKPRDGRTPPEAANGGTYTVPGNTEGLGAHLKCSCTNTPSIRNKQDKLEALVHSQSYDVLGVGETW